VEIFVVKMVTLILQFQLLERSLDAPVSIVENTGALHPPENVQELDKPGNMFRKKYSQRRLKIKLQSGNSF
jgi:hypothetical protein